MVPDHTTRPPYNRELPEEYWQELKNQDRYTQYRRAHPLPKPKPIKGWVILLGGIGIGLSMALVNHWRPPTSPLSAPAPMAAAIRTKATPIPAPPPLAASPTPAPAPRALAVSGPLTAEGAPMLSGQAYTVAMPDGRHLLVNYRGWVDHACNLPRQPRGGANNAMYTDAATGLNWIWTVPAGVSNVPRWIDP